VGGEADLAEWKPSRPNRAASSYRMLSGEEACLYLTPYFFAETQSNILQLFSGAAAWLYILSHYHWKLQLSAII